MNSWKMARCGLPMTCASTFSRPRCAMPSTMSRTPSAPPRLMICSSAGMSDSPPSSPKRLVPVYLMSMNFSKPSASTSLFRIARLPSGVKAIPLSGPSMRSWIQAFSFGIGDVHELDAERRAIGAAQDLQHLADGREFQAEHVVDEDRPVVVGLGEAVARRVQLLVVAAAARGRADRGWRADGRASGRRGSSSGRGWNRASPGRPSSSETSTPRACAPALIFSPSCRLDARSSWCRRRRRSRRWRWSGQSLRRHFGPRASAITASFGSFSVAKKLAPAGIDRCRVLLVAGIEVFEVGGVAAVEEGGLLEGFVRFSSCHLVSRGTAPRPFHSCARAVCAAPDTSRLAGLASALQQLRQRLPELGGRRRHADARRLHTPRSCPPRHPCRPK